MLRTAFKLVCILVCLTLIAPAVPRAQEEKRTNSDWIYILLGTGGLIYLLTHHPHTQAREPSPSPSPTSTPGTSSSSSVTTTTTVNISLTPPEQTPGPRHTPNIYGHEEVACKKSLDDGAFEAIQGPYQDDPIFKNKPDQLRREDGSKISYYGELDMVKDRPSTLAGVNAYVKNGTLTPIGSRNLIYMSGMTDCNAVEPIRMRFWLYEGGTKRKIYDSPKQYLPFLPPSNHTGQMVPWRMLVPAVLGQPEGSPFTFTRPGDFYAIEAELIDDHDRPIGFNMWLNGHVTQTAGPLTQLQPVVLTLTRSPTSFDDNSKALTDYAKTLQPEMFDNIPDVYPLAPRGFPMPRIGDPLNLSNGEVLDSSWKDHFQADIFVRGRHKDNLAAALTDRLGATAMMQGVQRSIALLSSKDMGLISGGGAAGLTLSTKVVAVLEGEDWTTPAHELAHSLPQYIWSSSSMQSECELDYHNKDTDISYGLQLTHKNVVTAPERHQGSPSDLMGPAASTAWNGQCTYAHLIDGLNSLVDPHVFLVRFGMARKPGGVEAKLLPSYDFRAGLTPDNKFGKYSVVLRNASGATIAGRRFDPPWIDENGARHDVIALQEHLPYSPFIDEVEVRGPAGVLDSFRLSKTKPSVTIDSAAIARGRLFLHWHGSGERGRTLRYSVLVSSDSGRTFFERIFEQKTTSANLKLYEKPPLVVRVLVTDGTRSARTQTSVK